jgi:rod shape-determining protein MreC
MPATFKSLLQWLAYAGLVVLAGGAMLLGKADALLVERLRLQVNDAVVPILSVLSKPVDAMADGIEGAQHLLRVAEENARLREERDRLLRWQLAAQRLEAENEALRQLLNFIPGPEATYRAARVVADPTGAFAHSLLVNAGSRDGIDKGHIVVTGDGLVGRIVGVSQRAARVLLITDLNSRVPVFVGAGRVPAVLAGDNADRPKLIHVVQQGKISVGDAVVTSGVAGGFPSGLPVGVVADVGDGGIAVQPLVDRTRLEYVRIADYGITSLLNDPPTVSRGGRAALPGGGQDRVRADAR